MVMENHPPPPELSDYVRYFQLIHFVFGNGETVPFKALAPRPEQCLCFFPADAEWVAYPDGPMNKLNRSMLMGQHTLVTNHHIGREFIAIRVIFQPGAFYRLTRIPSLHTTNCHIDAEAVFPGEINLVNERLGSTRSHKEMIGIIVAFLLHQVRKVKIDPHAADHAAQLILHHKGHLSLDNLSKQIYLSPRQLIRKFNERLGINPTLFARITRFETSLSLKIKAPLKNWLDVALQCGYYDYQHLVRDYRDFTGLGPAAFLKEDDKSPENKLGLIEKEYRP
jgi:AraC-like DNA-binding protein